MDTIIKSFSIAFLLRSVFSGAFFEFSYYLATHDIGKFGDGHIPDVSPSALFIALFVGVVAYGIHRAAIFPFVEWFMNSERATKARTRRPLISARTVNMLLLRWGHCRKEGEAPLASINSRIDAWADYAHLQYSSTLCIALGAAAAVVVSPIRPATSWGLISFAIFLWACAFMSHWRQMAVIDFASKAEPVARANGSACHASC